MIFWLGGESCIVKNEKWIVFPESRYVNSNPENTGIYQSKGEH